MPSAAHTDPDASNALASRVSPQVPAASQPLSLGLGVRAGAVLHPLAALASPATAPKWQPSTPQRLSDPVFFLQSSVAQDYNDVHGMSDLMREQCNLFVCRRCQQGAVLKILDSTTSDSLCAILQQHDTFGRLVHNDMTLWFQGQQMQAMGSLHDYGVQASARYCSLSHASARSLLAFKCVSSFPACFHMCQYVRFSPV